MMINNFSTDSDDGLMMINNLRTESYDDTSNCSTETYDDKQLQY